jgi:hypothetical protein
MVDCVTNSPFSFSFGVVVPIKLCQIFFELGQFHLFVQQAPHTEIAESSKECRVITTVEVCGNARIAFRVILHCRVGRKLAEAPQRVEFISLSYISVALICCHDRREFPSGYLQTFLEALENAKAAHLKRMKELAELAQATIVGVGTYWDDRALWERSFQDGWGSAQDRTLSADAGERALADELSLHRRTKSRVERVRAHGWRDLGAEC